MLEIKISPSLHWKEAAVLEEGAGVDHFDMFSMSMEDVRLLAQRQERGDDGYRRSPPRPEVIGAPHGSPSNWERLQRALEMLRRNKPERIVVPTTRGVVVLERVGRPDD